jgi:hypothetical protein
VTEASLSRLPAGTPGADDSELAVWAWQAARAQRPRDYSLLDLSVRRGLTPDEVADATAMSHSGIYAVLGRLRGSLEETFSATVLYYRGGAACPELADIVSAQTQMGPALRRDITRHAEGCQICRETRRVYPPPADILASFTVMEVDPETRSHIPEIEDRVAADSTAGAGIGAAGLLERATPDAEAPVADLAAANEDVTAIQAESLLLVADEEPAADSAAPPLEPEAQRPPETAVGSMPGREEHQERDLPAALTDTPGPGQERQPESPEPASEGEDASARELVVAEMAATAAARQPSGIGSGTFTSPSPGRQRPDGVSERERLTALGRAGAFGGLPPRRPWEGFADWLGENGPGRLSLFILLIGATVLAAYLGLAIGDSIEGGTSNSAATGFAALPTGQAGVRQIACGTGPIDVDQASPVTLSFDSDGRVIPGFQIADASVTAVSPAADAKSVSAKAQQSLTMALLAQPLAGTPGRVDEYKVNVTFTKLLERAVSECTVRVHAPLVTPTVAAAATASVSPSPPPRPAGQATVGAVATSVPASTAVPANTAAPTSTPARTATSTPTRIATPTN